MKIYGNIVDIHLRDVYPAEIVVSNGIIHSILRIAVAPDVYILPGLIDSHIHIESSMVTPGAFGFEAVRHGTTGVVSDPHEIANVMGMKGIDFMMRDAASSPVKFWFGAPSCVPATVFETNGAEITAGNIDELLKRSDILFLSEMMNFPGVISGDCEIISKIEAAKRVNKPIDGHAPGLSGDELQTYIGSGISTDHECSSLEEAKEKILLGMKVLIREGSAAKNLDSLKDLFNLFPEMIMLCSDDLHPEMLVKGHINKLVARLIREGYDVFDVLRSATINPVQHYSLNSGLLRAGDKGDFIIVDNLSTLNIFETWIDGIKVFCNGNQCFRYESLSVLNNFNCSSIHQNDIVVKNELFNYRVIEAFDGELITRELIFPSAFGTFVESDISSDILKIVVKDRYNDSPPVVGFIKGFGLKNGAFAGSVAHDSHNIICIGTNDMDISNAINEIVRLRGGLAVSACGKLNSLQLNIGGIMTSRSCVEVAAEYSSLNDLVKSLGCSMSAPFMTLSFMALLVIPDLKIGDRGLFDVREFKPVGLFKNPEHSDNIL